MKKIQTVLLQFILVASSGILLTGCQMMSDTFAAMHAKSGLVVIATVVVITAIVFFLFRMGSRRQDERADA